MTDDGDGPLEVVPVRHWWRYVAIALALVALAMLVHTLFSKVPSGTYSCSSATGTRVCHENLEWRFGWNIVFHYFTSHEILSGLLVTLEITAISMAVGILIGVFVAVMRLSPVRLPSMVAWLYTWFFRGTPVYVQLLFWFNIAALYQHFRFGVPFSHWDVLDVKANSLFTPFTAACTAFSLNEGAYMSEIARAGLISIDEGQIEAAKALGMTSGQTMRQIILPQAMRVILPPTGSEVISMLKTTSLASAVGVIELLGAASYIYSVNYQIMPLLITASLWYLIVSGILSTGQYYVERHFSQGATRTPPPTPLQRLRADLRGIGGKFRPHPMVPEAAR